MNADNIKDNKRVAITHGELFFMPTDEPVAQDAKCVTSFIAGHSETGHNHVIESESPFAVIERLRNTDLTVWLDAPARVVHKKTFDIHETKILAPGGYKIYEKQEYNPITKVVQRVFD